MQPMVPAFEAAAAAMPRAPRTVRVVSTVTGTLAEEEWRTLLLVRSVVAGEESATAG